MLDAPLRDLRSATRMLSGRPAWTTAAILCLAIATGANTAAFSLVDALLLRPLPFRHSEQLAMVALRDPKQTSVRPFALREYRELADHAGDVGTLFARTFFPLSLAAEDGARMAEAELVSGNYFVALGVQPSAGRFFDAREDRADAPPTVVLSDRLWRRRFNASPAVVGQTVRVNGRLATIAGVAPPDFVGAMRLIAADLWLPASMYPELAGSPRATDVPMFGVMARLRPGLDPATGEARLNVIAAALGHERAEATSPVTVVTPASGFGVPVAIQGSVLQLSSLIYLLMALVMAVACANVAVLMLARGAGRTREMVVRLSLGASRVQLARQLLTETFVLAIAGCGLGTIVASWASRALVASLTTPFQYVSYAIDVQPDARLFVYAALATSLAAVLSAAGPLRHAIRVDILAGLSETAARGSSRTPKRALNAMVITQFAVSTTLLAAAGMLVTSYYHAAAATPAFSTDHVILAGVDMGQLRESPAAGLGHYRDIANRLAAIPGVTSVGLTRDLPLTAPPTVVVTASDAASSDRTQSLRASAMVVSSRYFDVLGVPMQQGHVFGDAGAPGPRVAVVNASLARRLWTSQSPVGHTFRLGESEAIEVVGVVADMKEASFTERATPEFYEPLAQQYNPRMTFLIRMPGDAAGRLEDVRQAIRGVNPDLAVVDLRTLDQWIDGMLDQRRLPAMALSGVGLLGLLLTAVGLYGVMAFSVRERVRELGIRLALGARPADVRRLVLREGLTVVAIGLIIGGAGIALFSQLIRSALFGVSSLPALATAGAFGVLAIVAFAALYHPARWASRVEPTVALRND